MIEQTGDIWKARKPGEWVGVTINGTLRNDGWLVMGRGIAKEAAEKHPNLQRDLGILIKQGGLRLMALPNRKLIAFPVKYEFYQKADLNLILKSVLQLVEIAPQLPGRILLPRPGCGFGKLDWLEVMPMMAHYLPDERFVVFKK